MAKFSNALIAGATALSLSIASIAPAAAFSSLSSESGKATQTQTTKDPKAAELEELARQTVSQAGFKHTNSLQPYIDEGIAKIKGGSIAFTDGIWEGLSNDGKTVTIIEQMSPAELDNTIIESKVALKDKEIFDLEISLSVDFEVTKIGNFYYTVLVTPLDEIAQYM